jgi:hypothetical protein
VQLQKANERIAAMETWSVRLFVTPTQNPSRCVAQAPFRIIVRVCSFSRRHEASLQAADSWNMERNRMNQKVKEVILAKHIKMVRVYPQKVAARVTSRD